ncbi:MAG: hypothetical protein ACRDA8_14405, partial [Shewanella sp.]
YQSADTLTDTGLRQAFTLSFGTPWLPSQDPHFNELQYSFAAIVNEGPQYYQGLWQAALAQLIYEQTHCQDPAGIFDLLVVNDSGRDLKALLTATLGAPLSPWQVIDKMAKSQSFHHAPSWTSATPLALCSTMAL